MTSTNFLKEISFKFKLYGLLNFIKFSFIELYRLTLRSFRVSYSQFQEDVYISRLLNKKYISYIDIGANHPIKFNNTFKFYLNGGQGINIEPNSLFINDFKKIRPRDINLNFGLSHKNDTLTFYKFNPHVASTFSQKEASRATKRGCVLLEKVPIKVTTLKNIFQKYLKTNYVDFISIDTEKYDYNVLMGNDWNKYRTKIICIESNNPKVRQFLKSNSYKLIKTIGLNHIYQDTINE